MTTDSIHLINEHKQFNTELVKYLSNCYDFSEDNGLNYHIVSVFGSQSSGKSTLLNRLFGTQFDVMDELKRQQTTKGIWFSHANHISSSTGVESTSHPNKNNIFVLDVEGADGRERADDKDFERKAALFALATSEVLIINIWENQVGLYQGANMELLKTVLEVNLSLFHSNKQKVLLLFVIRDFTGSTSLENLSSTLTSDMQKTWDSLSKPEDAQDYQLGDFFDLGFHAVGHKIFQNETFEKNVGELGDKFNSQSEIFKKEYHRGIPIDAWAIYSEQIWNQVEENKDLDLPTQQILVARFRCDEIMNDVYNIFLLSYQDTDFDKIESDSNAVLNDMKKLRNNSLELFDQQASRYNLSVYQERRTILLSKIDSTLKIIYDTQVDKISSEILSNLVSLVSSSKKNRKGTPYVDIISSVTEDLLKKFEIEVSFFEIDEAYSASKETELFKIKLYEFVENMKNKERLSLISRVTRSFQKKFKEYTVESLNSPTESSWDEILSEFKNIEDKSLAKYASNDNDEYDFQLGLDSKTNHNTAQELKKLFWTKFYDIIHDYLTEDSIARILRNVFEDSFKYDDDGLPRIWRTFDEVDNCFNTARSKWNKLLPVLSVAKLLDGEEIIPDVDISHQHSESDVESDIEEMPNHFFAHILTEKQQNKVSHRLKKETDAIYIEAKRSIVANTSSIPIYIYIIIAILGWNEFVFVLKNPLLFLLSILLISGFYLAYNTQMLGPIISVTTAALNQSKKVAKDRLKEYLLDDTTPPTTKSEEIEMDDLAK
ncbi:dynamin-like GTPase [Martiniozyma asiatica (nom. inval.)]|nr:dynamin-like GTPase [Martiniozyma asiatica]